MIRNHFTITGIVQGVGFRPFVYRLATELGLTGLVRNTSAGVELELQGGADRLDSIRYRLQEELPPLATITSIDSSEIPQITNETRFEILPSTDGKREVQIAPDTALCKDCLRELLDSAGRRYQHPFITCTNCGPRWTIVTGIPYDRPLTTMSGFPLCPACEAEYRNPKDRRFHAQPIACHGCGPQLSIVPYHPDPLPNAVERLQQGQIVAVKGLGGYHLAVDACSDKAVARLRQRKLRDEKPFAVMVPDLTVARRLAELSEMEERLLTGPEAAPVVIVHRHSSHISPLVAPGSQWIGMMLAYTPLHQLLFTDTRLDALVMTSANASDEPMIADDDEALERLSGIADAILAHNRSIHVRTDDSVLRVFQGKPLFYRRSRGYVPRPVTLPFDAVEVLAVGGELKNTICLTRGNLAFVSQHIGDLKNEATLDTFRLSIKHLSDIMEIRPQLVASDNHPDYLSTRYAEELALPIIRIQHHHAHLASCMAENGLVGEVIGVILDGTGLGDDGTVWGGEFLTGGYRKVERAGHFHPVRLPGGDAAARDTWRMALSYLHQAFGDAVWKMDINGMPSISSSGHAAIRLMLEKGFNSPLSSSAGRLFDAVASILGLCNRNSFDGQAGMALESIAETTEDLVPLQFTMLPGFPFQLSFVPMVKELFKRFSSGENVARLARAFHKCLAEAVLAGCIHIRNNNGLNRVVLSGGVFQNRLLSEMLHARLVEQGFECYLHRLVPPNDGGISLGQAAIAARRI